MIPGKRDEMFESLENNEKSFNKEDVLHIYVMDSKVPDDFTINTLRERQNGRHLADKNFKFIFLYEYCSIL